MKSKFHHIQLTVKCRCKKISPSGMDMKPRLQSIGEIEIQWLEIPVIQCAII